MSNIARVQRPTRRGNRREITSVWRFQEEQFFHLARCDRTAGMVRLFEEAVNAVWASRQFRKRAGYNQARCIVVIVSDDVGEERFFLLHGRISSR